MSGNVDWKNWKTFFEIDAPVQNDLVNSKTSTVAQEESGVPSLDVVLASLDQEERKEKENCKNSKHRSRVEETKGDETTYKGEKSSIDANESISTLSGQFNSSIDNERFLMADGAGSSGSMDEGQSTEVPSLADIIGALDVDELDVLYPERSIDGEDTGLPIISRAEWLASRTDINLLDRAPPSSASNQTLSLLYPSVEQCIAEIDRAEAADEKAEQACRSNAQIADVWERMGAGYIDKPMSWEPTRRRLRNDHTLESKQVSNAVAENTPKQTLAPLGKSSLAEKLKMVSQTGKESAPKTKSAGVFHGLFR